MFCELLQPHHPLLSLLLLPLHALTTARCCSDMILAATSQHNLLRATKLFITNRIQEPEVVEAMADAKKALPNACQMIASQQQSTSRWW